jgi:uncharacterized membrane-anchored protein
VKSETTSQGVKVPEATLLFWILKILATTLGETGGDAVTMTLGWGYLLGTLLFAALFAVVVVVQTTRRTFHPVVYWLAIVSTTTVGTTLADFADRSLGIGYLGGTTLLVALLALSLFAWWKGTGSIAVGSVSTPRAEIHYWVAILFSQTLGTALGDWTADSLDMGYLGASALFGGLLAAIALLRLWPRVPRAGLFWAAFILTRPLGAVLGDFLDKPHDQGGLALSRFGATSVLLGLLAAGVLLLPQRAATRSH